MKQYGFQELGSEDEAGVPVEETKAKDIVFDRNENGDLILPRKTDFKNLRQKQRVVRGYVGASYSKHIHLKQSFSF